MRGLVAALIVAFAGCSMTVKGIVHDKVTHAPIAGALVGIEGAGQATTNEDGLYVLSVSSSQEPVAVNVRAVSYFPWADMRTFQKSQGNPLVLNFEMTHEDDVVRKRERFEAAQEKTPPNITVTNQGK